ncbi:MAG: acyl-[acyl-carrier-protein] thioesterase [Leptospiraceae bacterium]|nr:acyl-[acyl-carrier-protein] thioesterase [Leptospiraceae bacterium]
MKNSIFIRAHFFDLDWNRHVTSRVYEKFSQEGRVKLLAENGYNLQKCMEDGLILIPESTQVRFLAQQFSGSNLKINTEATAFKDCKILWDHKIYGEDEKLACELKILTKGQNKNLEPFSFLDSNESIPKDVIIEIKPFSNSCLRLTNDYPILFSDMNCFWSYSPDAVWKVFEEGRWLFFSKIIDLNRIKDMDTTSFFMGGKIQFFRLPIAGEKAKLHTWIDKVEKIRFYIRQDLVGEDGNLIASMKDEQLFVALSTSRPRKAPEDFVKIVGEYVEYVHRG